MKHNEHTANQSLHSAALERKRIADALSGSKVAQRQRYQRVAKKQHNVLWFCVMLSASAFIGVLLAY